MKKSAKNQKLREHVVDSTAITISTVPIYALLETQCAGISNGLSMHARLLATGLTYSGTGTLYSKGRDISRQVFDVAQKSKTYARLHDAAYGFAFNLVLNPPFYFAAGSRNVKEIMWGTLSGCIAGLFAGIPAGYAIDAYRDLTGLEKSEILPDWIKNKNAYVKTVLALLGAGASAATLATIYHFNK